MDQYIHSRCEIRKSDIITTLNRDFYLSKGLYLPQNNWSDHIKKLHEVKAVMPPSHDLIDIIIDLDSRKKFFDGNDNAVSGKQKLLILKRIIEKVGPWRAENLDNYFHNFDGDFYMDTEHILVNENIEHKKRKKINVRRDGLAKKLEGREVYFINPGNNTVAGFVAGSNWAILSYNGNPSLSFAGLGVRAKFFDISHLDK